MKNKDDEILFLDLHLPDANGIELIKTVVKDPSYQPAGVNLDHITHKTS